MMPEFSHPNFLLFALAAIPAALIYFVRLRKARASLAAFIASAERGQGRTAHVRLGRALGYRAVCFLLAWVALAVGAAGPRWGTRLVGQRQEGSSVVFVVDISRSMTLTDVAPTRLEFAARYASLLTERMEKTPCGLVLAKGDAVLALPITADHRAVRDLLSSLSPALLTSPGSSPGKGVAPRSRARSCSLPTATKPPRRSRTPRGDARPRA
jgi:Ca-activated chloride channel family protein